MTLSVGTPVTGHYDRHGWIASVKEDNRGNVYTIGASGMKPNRDLVSVVWDNETTSTDLSEHIVSPWIAKAYHDAKPAEEVTELFAAAQKAEAARRVEQKAEQEAFQQKQSDWRDSIRDKIPADAKAVIVAQMKVDQCDSQTDYFGSSTSRVVILAFSRHTRDLFPELRKAALNFEETAFLADGPADWEHREKYSMGGGYYLKEGWRHRTGWQVSKQTLYTRGNDIAEALPYGDWSVPEGQPYPTGNKAAPQATEGATEASSVGGFTIGEHTHTKRGFQMWIVSPAGRVDRDTFTAWLDKAKAKGGWYSRKWGSTPAGFAFKDEQAAHTFAAELSEKAA